MAWKPPANLDMARLRQVWALRGPEDAPRLTYRAIGARIGVSGERARQLYWCARHWHRRGFLEQSDG